jgi:hypothetical protein
MNASTRADHGRDLQIVVDERQIAGEWQHLDLDGLGARIGAGDRAEDVVVRARLGALDVSAVANRRTRRRASLASSGRLLRVPDAAFVIIGRDSAARSLPTPAAQVANDNDAARGARTRSAVRDAIFLVVLGLTLVGAFYSGRMHAAQNVIVVEPPASARHAIG